MKQQEPEDENVNDKVKEARKDFDEAFSAIKSKTRRKKRENFDDVVMKQL